ncbi:MAG: DoxX family protein [Bacteroidales bacterium]|nr:DoxX family protein [Bacteroidales bacterium]MBN2697266.1 DoxX family protein [Bacteroidales bacterium]
MNFLRLLSRFIVGIVFIFSGFVKAVDPLGSAYKFTDYFHAFGLDFLTVLALPLAIFLAAIELVLGLTLIMGFQRKVSYWVLFLFMSFFTLLTLVLAIFNPVADCGCFGDAIILTNWQTFFKNIILMPFVLLLFFNRNRRYHGYGDPFEWGVISALFAAVVLFSVNSYRHLPLLDFRPYDVGTHVAEEMTIPDGAPADQYKTKLFYRERSSGKIRSFTLENYPKDTLKWEFVNSESKLIRKGYEPPIQDFAIQDPYGEEITGQILNDPGYALLMFCQDIDKSNPTALENSNEWANLQLITGDYKFYAVTSSNQQQVTMVKEEYGLIYDFYSADEILLKTVVRSNPGFLLLKDGIIIGKWSWRDFPSVADIDPSWPEMVEQASSTINEEAFFTEEWNYEPTGFDVVRFDRPAMKYIFGEAGNLCKNLIITGFLLLLLLLYSVTGLFVLLKKKKR